MKRHLRVAASNGGTPAGRQAGLTAERERHRAETVGRRGRSRLHLASERSWQHTLVLTGTLDRRSAAELEEEIECLCEEGVTSLTLDLRLLEEMDATGVQVIAFRSTLCRRRGHELAVIPGSAAIQRALVEAGAEFVLEPVVVGREPGAGGVAEREVRTTMVRDL
jgi:anti-anti-sigma factor